MKLRFEMFMIVAFLMLVQIDAQSKNPATENLSGKRHPVFHDAIFPQAKISSCDIQGEIYNSPQLDISVEGAEINIHGTTDSIRTWATSISFNGPGCEIYLSDLNRNGRQSIIVFTPGIGSMGAYDGHLFILLFDDEGQPTPWEATGLFSASEFGVNEIRKSSSNGYAFILHNYAIGHPSWGGVSYLSTAYRITGNNITKVRGELSGNKLPYIAGEKSNDPGVVDLSNEADISLIDESIASKQIVRRKFVRYGTEDSIRESGISQSKTNAILPEQRGQNIMVDINKLNNVQEKIELSDGVRLELPSILVVDSPDKRQIVFNPGGPDVSRLLESGVHSVLQEGNECEDVGFCRSFLLWAKK